jgi:hypothetical protein
MRAVPQFGQVLLVGYGVDEVLRHDEPAKAQCGRECLADGAGIDDAVRLQALKRPDGGSVVAILGVVVILDRDRVPFAKPFEEPRPSIARKDRAGGVLVCRREDDRVDIGLLELLDPHPALVDCDRHDLEARRGYHPTLLRVARVLEGDPLRAPRAEDPADDALALRIPRGDHHPRRVGDHAADAPEVLGERRAQGLDTTRVSVEEVQIGDLGDRLAQRAKPGGAREARDVRGARTEIESGDRRSNGRLG